MDACILVWFNIESAKTVSYINFRRKNTQSELGAGQIAANYPTHTKEEWLKILQAKSQAQGERLSWWQIKQDPELNHQEIMAKLGYYAAYEDKLFVKPETSEPVPEEQVESIQTEMNEAKANDDEANETEVRDGEMAIDNKTAKSEPSTVSKQIEKAEPQPDLDPEPRSHPEPESDFELQPNPKSDLSPKPQPKSKVACAQLRSRRPQQQVIWLLQQHDVPTKQSRRVWPIFETGYLGRITSPTDRPWERRGVIIISKINEEGVERHLNFAQVEVVQDGQNDFSVSDLQRIFAGLDKACHVCDLIVGREQIQVEIQQRDRTAKPRLMLRFLPGEKSRLFIGLVLFTGQYDCENYDYIVCDCIGLETKQQTMIIDSKYYSCYQ